MRGLDAKLSHREDSGRQPPAAGGQRPPTLTHLGRSPACAWRSSSPPPPRPRAARPGSPRRRGAGAARGPQPAAAAAGAGRGGGGAGGGPAGGVAALGGAPVTPGRSARRVPLPPAPTPGCSRCARIVSIPADGRAGPRSWPARRANGPSYPGCAGAEGLRAGPGPSCPSRAGGDEAEATPITGGEGGKGRAPAPP